MKPHRLPVYCLARSITHSATANPKYVSKAQSGKENFERDFEKSHIKTNLFQKILLSVGSGVVSLTSPSRGDMIAVMGEVTGHQALQYIQSKMNQTEEGRKILEEKPRISSESVDLEKLKSYPEGTLGKAYSNFLEKYGYTPDTRNAVQFVDDLELAYVAQRYRETHDLIHTVLDMPTNMLGEVTVKWVEAIQFKLPMCATGALFGAVRLAPKFTRSYSSKHIIKLNPSLVEDLENKVVHPRRHPGVMKLPTVALREDIANTIRTIIRGDINRKLINDLAVKLDRQLNCRFLPPEESDRDLKRKELYERFKEKLKLDEVEDETVKNQLKRKVENFLRSELYNWKPMKYNWFKSLQYLVVRAPAEYAVLRRVFNEIHKRDEKFAPTTLFDFGSGVGTVNWAAHYIWGDTLNEYYCVDSSGDMNRLAGLILRENDPDKQPMIKNVYYRQFFPATPRPYDIVVSSFSFFELPSSEQRIRILTNLWNNTKDYLVLIENGTVQGFRVIAEAREYFSILAKEFKLEYHIFAPCPHEFECPVINGPGENLCNFEVKFEKLSFTKEQRVATKKFCYLILKRGKRPPESQGQSRLIKRVLPRGGHAVCNLCTYEGECLRFFITASKHGRHAYNCVRRSNWGDLVPGILQQKLIDAGGEKQRDELHERKTDPGELISDSDSDSESDSEPESSEKINKQRKKYVSTHLPWAVETGRNCGFLLGVYFEDRWDQPISELYKEFNIKPLPDEPRLFSKM